MLTGLGAVEFVLDAYSIVITHCEWEGLSIAELEDDVGGGYLNGHDDWGAFDDIHFPFVFQDSWVSENGISHLGRNWGDNRGVYDWMLDISCNIASLSKLRHQLPILVLNLHHVSLYFVSVEIIKTISKVIFRWSVVVAISIGL